MSRAKIKSYLQSTKPSPRFLLIGVPILIIFFGITFTLFGPYFTRLVHASFGSWGDTSLINACQDARGRVTLVSPGTNCNTNETQVTWLKDVDAGSGLTISRSSSGATLSLTNSATQHLWATGSGLTSFSQATWTDVPNAAITQTFTAGVWKATFTGGFVMTNGDGTAYVRVEMRPNGGSNIDSQNYVTVEHVSSPSNTEQITEPFTFQALLNVPSGSVTIVPQVFMNNTSWSLLGPSTFILDH